MMDLFKKQRASSILGLVLDGSGVEGVLLRRSHNGFEIKGKLNATLALSPLTGDPELAGREIRNHLDEAGIRERSCVLIIPLNWMMTVQASVPDLPEEDAKAFLEMEAERGFHCGVETLRVAESRWRFGGQQQATLMAVPRAQLAALQQVLKAAQLRLVACGLGVVELQKNQSGNDGVTLSLGQNSADLLVACGGGIAAIRSLDGVVETDGTDKWFEADKIARELRITLGQLPADICRTLKTVRVYGRGEATEELTHELSGHVRAMGLSLEWAKPSAKAQSDDLRADSPAFAAAENWLNGKPPIPDFLPPKAHPWKQLFAAKLSSRKLVWTGGAAGFAVFCACAGFGFQQWQITRLESEWQSVEPRVEALQAAQQQIKAYRPWFDGSCRTLRILRKLSEVFPEDGAVSLKNLEIQDLSNVTCTGVARDNRSFLKLLDRLRAAQEISGLNIDQVRGQGPQQFTFHFCWEGGSASGH